MINFIDEGPAHQIKIGLDIKEFDPVLLSNFNFRCPDSFKFCITESGLEEVRAVLTYQLMQKHVLIVATRINQLLIDSSMKALCELDLIKNAGISIPNSVIDPNNAYSKNSDSLSNSGIHEMKTKFSRNLTSQVKDIFFDVKSKKAGISNIQIEFNNCLNHVQRAPPAKP